MPGHQHLLAGNEPGAGLPGWPEEGGGVAMAMACSHVAVGREQPRTDLVVNDVNNISK